MTRTFHREASSIGLWLVALVLLLTWITGCTFTLSDQGEVSVEFTQGVKVRHTTSATNAESKASTDFKPLVDYIIELRGPQDEKEPTTQPAVNE